MWCAGSGADPEIRKSLVNIFDWQTMKRCVRSAAKKRVADLIHSSIRVEDLGPLVMPVLSPNNAGTDANDEGDDKPVKRGVKRELSTEMTAVSTNLSLSPSNDFDPPVKTEFVDHVIPHSQVDECFVRRPLPLPHDDAPRTPEGGVDECFTRRPPPLPRLSARKSNPKGKKARG